MLEVNALGSVQKQEVSRRQLLKSSGEGQTNQSQLTRVNCRGYSAPHRIRFQGWARCDRWQSGRGMGRSEAEGCASGGPFPVGDQQHACAAGGRLTWHCHIATLTWQLPCTDFDSGSRGQVRDNAILVNLGSLRAIATPESVLIFDHQRCVDPPLTQCEAGREGVLRVLPPSWFFLPATGPKRFWRRSFSA